METKAASSQWMDYIIRSALIADSLDDGLTDVENTNVFNEEVGPYFSEDIGEQESLHSQEMVHKLRRDVRQLQAGLKQITQDMDALNRKIEGNKDAISDIHSHLATVWDHVKESNRWMFKVKKQFEGCTCRTD
ncbi:hypothetical protein BJX96DRAFT_157074 [Aspergillus floccosus]